jgi:signal transduction histidine kinase
VRQARAHRQSRSYEIFESHENFKRLQQAERGVVQQAERGVEEVTAQERLRIAADIHDLVLQNLVLALAGARALAQGQAPDAPERTGAVAVAAAAERAVAGARQILDELKTRERVPVVQAVETGVRVAAGDTPLRFDASGVPAGVQPDPPTLDALVHIGREAVTNAVKHAAPCTVEVVLERADEWRLRVRNDGRGWAPTDIEKSENGGFGLGSMRRCAQTLGGALHITSAHDTGTTVEATLP